MSSCIRMIWYGLGNDVFIRLGDIIIMDEQIEREEMDRMKDSDVSSKRIEEADNDQNDP